MAEQIQLLITVKTYPLPSRSYKELVCTAGVKEDGSFIRLYPIPYRYNPYKEWFKKYQWVQLKVEKARDDPRPESYNPIGIIRPLGPPIGTERNWFARKKYVLAKGVQSMCYLEKQKQKVVSLGVIKPRKVYDFTYEPIQRYWKEQWLAFIKQLNLFDIARKPLEKIPYRFTYRFKCEESRCSGHKKMIEDWEVGQLYRSMRDKYGDEKMACEKVKEKFLNHICSSNIDTHFFVGTVLKFGSWVIIGTFWPKKEA